MGDSPKALKAPILIAVDAVVDDLAKERDALIADRTRAEKRMYHLGVENGIITAAIGEFCARLAKKLESESVTVR